LVGNKNAAVADIIATEALPVVLSSGNGVTETNASSDAGLECHVRVIGSLVLKDTAIDTVYPASSILPAFWESGRNRDRRSSC
jgi:hypothetical protein